MAKLKIDPIEIPDETLQIIETHRQAMPMDEFLSFCIQFGAADIRDAWQQDRRDYTARSMSERIAHYHRMENDLFAKRSGDPPQIVPLNRASKDRD